MSFFEKWQFETFENRLVAQSPVTANESIQEEDPIICEKVKYLVVDLQDILIHQIKVILPLSRFLNGFSIIDFELE